MMESISSVRILYDMYPTIAILTKDLATSKTESLFMSLPIPCIGLSFPRSNCSFSELIVIPP